ncbi:MAG: hypothetical protein GX774_01540 [Armatimonadetes bacterium]|nr:hypothetical protein [Armatimonadota bacterium]
MAILAVSALVGTVAVRLRQPLICAFIAVGILLGPSGLDWIQSNDQIHLLGEIGLAVLLFVVGLKLDLHLIRSMGPVSLATGLGQVAFTSVGGFFLAWALGMTPLTALYVAVALTFSSTIIVVKLLSDKRETEALHGRIALGFLIVQDLVVVLAMVGLSVLAGQSHLHPGLQVLLVLVKAAGMIAVVSLASFLVLPRLVPLLGRSTELLVLFSIAWALALAHLGSVLGFSKEVGAFAAGVSLASTAYRDILGARLVALRDFLLLFFFLDLGSRLDMGALGSQVVASVVLSLFVLIGNPIIVMVIMGYMGYRRRTGLLAGLTVAQISEFSLILIAMGAAAGHVGQDAVGVVTLVGLITIGLSTYMILYSQPLYEWLAPYLGIFERKVPYREDAVKGLAVGTRTADVVLFGLGRYGSAIARGLMERDRHVLGVDFNPQAVREWTALGWPAVYGDAEDPEFASLLPLAGARWVVSSIREPRVNAAIAQAVRHAGYRGNLALSGDARAEVAGAAGDAADLFLVPFENAAEQAVALLLATEEEIARRHMDKVIEALSDHYIICGFGRMGQQICRDLQRQGFPHVVVEENPEQLPRLKEREVLHVAGKACEDEVLIRAGIGRARGLIAVAATDEENVFIVLTARVLNPRLQIVARSILEENEDKLRRAGADRVISPYILGGRRMAAAVMKPGVMDFVDLVLHDDSVDTDIVDVAVTAGSPAANKTLGELNLWQAYGVTVLALKHPGEELAAAPSPEVVLREGTELILMGRASQIAEASRVLTNNQPDRW